MAEMQDEMTAEATVQTIDPIDLAANIVAAYVSNNSLPAAELASLIAGVHQAVAGLANGTTSPPAQADEEIQKATPAQIRKSVTPDGIVSFIDGKSYKTMKRHLTTHGLDPSAYRQRYGLPSDYPMVAASYAAQRSELARSIGLGRPGGMVRSEDPTTDAASEPKKRGRKAA